MHKYFNETQVHMNTKVNIQVLSDLSTIETYDLLDEAFGRFSYVVKNFSRFDLTTDLSKLNYSKQYPQKVSKELFYLIKSSIDLAKLSDGIYDPSILDILETYGYGTNKLKGEPNYKKIINNLEKELNHRPDWRDIVLNHKNLSVELKQNQKIDLGSIGKGYAIDLASKVLKPINNYLINAGGDIYAHGEDQNESDWKIGLTCPWDIEKIFGVLELKNTSIACSGSSVIKYGNIHHLINPKNGKPVNKIDQSFVIHKSAMWADGYATLLYLTGRKGLSILEDQKIGGMIVKNKRYFKNKYFPELIIN